MSLLNLPHLTVGDRVHGELLVLDRAEKTQAGGDPFVILTLGNASGHIATAPIWADKRQWVDGVDKGKVVQVIGDVGTYKGKRQIQLTSQLHVVPTDAAALERFLPRIGQDRAQLWGWLDRTRGEIRPPRLRRVLDLFFADDDFRVRFERAPGSVNGHHAKLGGLLLHVYEVTSIARQTARTTKADIDLVVAGALLHDLGKVDAYGIGPSGFEHTPCGLLLGHVVLGCLMLERRIAELGRDVCTPGQLLELQHLILAHHGSFEFGSPVRPMTLEAEILHWADEASAKTNDMMEALEDGDEFTGGGELSDRKPWRVGRRVWRRPHTWD